MNEVEDRQERQIAKLETELQQHKGFIWVLGEMIKVADTVSSFTELMQVMMDMLIGMTGVNNCYLWLEHDDITQAYLNSTQGHNQFMELDESSIHESIKSIQEMTYFCKSEAICFPIIEGMAIPGSRLIIPLRDFNKGSIIGGMVLEHCQEHFFTDTETLFFETLATFITSHAKNSKLFERVSEESSKDPLTGVYNRRYLDKMIEEFIGEHGHLTVGVFDSDNFKLVNDLLGHIKGDEVLQILAGAAEDFLQSYKGHVVRYGGDEFVILIPKPLQESIEILKSFQQIVPKLPGIQEMSIPITITIGVCTYPEMTRDKHVLVKVADYALLRGKTEGKNCIKIASKIDFNSIKDEE